MHALVIEDEPLIALLIEDRLRALGFNSVDLATTEAEAVAAARSRCPDFITSDVRLATGCGIAAVQAICGGGEIPVLFITSTASEARDRIQDAIILEKPFALAELDAAILDRLRHQSWPPISPDPGPVNC